LLNLKEKRTKIARTVISVSGRISRNRPEEDEREMESMKKRERERDRVK